MASGKIRHRISLACGIMLIALTCAACSDDSNKIGSTVKGTRIAVMDSSKSIKPDSDLQPQKPEMYEAQTNANWPQAGFDSSHLEPNANISEHPKEKWRSNLGAGSGSDYKLLARPVILDHRVYTMDAKGVVTAFDAKDGDSVWSFDTTPEDADDNEIGGGIGVDGDTVYATTGFGEVLALRASDGAVKWRQKLLDPLRAAPTIAEGHVYVVSIDNQLTALDAKTGNILWHHNGIAESATLMGASNPAVVGDSVVVAYSSGEIFNLRAENGRVAWNYALTTPTQVGALPAIADIRGLPVVDHGRVYAISHSGRMAAIDQRSGDRTWEADIGGINTPIVGVDTVFVLTNDGQLAALTRESGRIIWVHDMQHLSDPDDHDSDPVFWSGPVLAGGKLWLTNSMGQLASFSLDGGNQIDTIEIGDDPILMPPVIADGTIYVVTDNGYLVALR
jgi:outer membrane protein assembly factor BamB